MAHKHTRLLNQALDPLDLVSLHMLVPVVIELGCS